MTAPDRCPRCDRAECKREEAKAAWDAERVAYEPFWQMVCAGAEHPGILPAKNRLEAATAKSAAAFDDCCAHAVDWRARCLAAETQHAAQVETMGAMLAGVRAEADVLRTQRDEARETNKRLARRAQEAESIIARSGIVEGRPRSEQGRSLGRALANYAAAQYERERNEARADRDALRAEVERLQAQLYETRDSMCDAVPRAALFSLLRGVACEAFRRARLNGVPNTDEAIEGAVKEGIANVDAGCVVSWLDEKLAAESALATVIADRDALRADVERLAKERDEQAASLELACRNLALECRRANERCDERDHARREAAEYANRLDDERLKRGEALRDLAEANAALARLTSTDAPTAADAFKDVLGWCAYYRDMNLLPAALAIVDEIEVHIRASMERMKRGESMHATTPLADLDASPVRLTATDAGRERDAETVREELDDLWSTVPEWFSDKYLAVHQEALAALDRLAARSGGKEGGK